MADKINLQAEERTVLGKKVKKLRREGQLPAHVFGKGVEGEVVSLKTVDFLKTFAIAGETGLINLKIGAEKVRPVLIREVQYDAVLGSPIHVDFYQVNLAVKVKVPVPLELIGEQPESVKLGEAIVLQTLNEVEVEALPADLIEKIEIDITGLKNIDDAITVGSLNYDREKLTIAIDPEEIVVKLAPAVTAEMEALMQEQAAETAAAQAEATAEGEPASAEATAGEEGGVEGETPVEGEVPDESGQEKAEVTEEKKE